jgi:hypothetical protein
MAIYSPFASPKFLTRKGENNTPRTSKNEKTIMLMNLFPAIWAIEKYDNQ